MGGYLRCFNKTGDPGTDAILDVLREAGDAFHHTENWGDDYHGSPTYVERIQAAADAAALSSKRSDEIGDDASALEQLRAFVAAKRFDRDAFEDDTAMVDWMLSRARHILAARDAK